MTAPSGGQHQQELSTSAIGPGTLKKRIRMIQGGVKGTHLVQRASLQCPQLVLSHSRTPSSSVDLSSSESPVPHHPFLTLQWLVVLLSMTLSKHEQIAHHHVLYVVGFQSGALLCFEIGNHANDEVVKSDTRFLMMVMIYAPYKSTSLFSDPIPPYHAL